jgi:hypothetical protein
MGRCPCVSVLPVCVCVCVCVWVRFVCVRAYTRCVVDPSCSARGYAQVRYELDDEFNITYSSGTTGLPK